MNKNAGLLGMDPSIRLLSCDGPGEPVKVKVESSDVQSAVPEEAEDVDL